MRQTNDSWINIFSQPGQSILEEVKSGEAQQVGEEERSPFGKLLISRKTNPQNGIGGTSSVRAEAPHVWAEWVSVDKEGKTIQSVRLTRWEWFDTAQLGNSFWLAAYGRCG